MAIAHRHAEPPGRAQSLDQLLDRGLDQALADAAEEREQDDGDLVGRGPEAIPRLDARRGRSSPARSPPGPT